MQSLLVEDRKVSKGKQKTHKKIPSDHHEQINTSLGKKQKVCRPYSSDSVFVTTGNSSMFQSGEPFVACVKSSPATTHYLQVMRFLNM
jgi:hypothetical protein